MDLITLPRGSQLTPTYLALASNLTYEEWQQTLLKVAQYHATFNFAVGDALLYGSHKYGEMYAQATAETGLSPDTLMTLLYVATHVPPLIRSKNLTWSHHREVAKLEPTEQKEWLDRCETENWDVRDLCEQLVLAGLRKSKMKEITASPSANGDYLIVEGADFDKLAATPPELSCDICGHAGGHYTVVCNSCFNEMQVMRGKNNDDM